MLTALQGHWDLSRIINRFSRCRALGIHCIASLKPDLILLSKKWSFCCCFSPSVISHGCQGDQCVSFQHRLLGLRKEVLQCWPAIFIEPLHNTIYESFLSVFYCTKGKLSLMTLKCLMEDVR